MERKSGMQFANHLRVSATVLIVLLNSVFALAQEDWVAPIANRSLPAVVTVLGFDGAGKQFGLGSGFIVREDGIVVTNYHVIKNAAAVEVRGKAVGAFRARGVVAMDRDLDFAALKIAGDELPVLPLGNSNQVRLGEGVVAIGNPKGLTGTISAGLISQVREEGEFPLLQTSAPIYPGNSGGPLINKRGEVIGVITARVADGPTLGLALPINYVRRALQGSVAVKHSFGALAQWEARVSVKEKEERIRAVIRENFMAYADPGGLFRLVVPKGWRVQRDQSWSDDRSSLYHTTVIAPEQARLTQIHGYVSEGVRIQARLPRPGAVWTRQTIEQWKTDVAKNLLKANPGFALTDSGTMEFGDMSAKVYHFVGQDRRLPEPEKTVMVVIARPDALLTVELIAPTSKLDLLDVIQLISAATFEWQGR
jgi:S1-C subfamily serine protease